jgi:crotonobetainyl-CoA:carnitine CoA-transferase CaiB-like acyl-CoA transferase
LLGRVGAKAARCLDCVSYPEALMGEVRRGSREQGDVLPTGTRNMSMTDGPFQFGTMAGKPLDGIRVLELARVLAGPWAGQLLADLGADVVKVEHPIAGDDTRDWGPPFVPAANGGTLSSGYFHSTNRGKRSVTADLETVEGRSFVAKLAANADILIENFKVGGLARYGLDYPTLASNNPRLVYCSVTGFGQDGPYAHRPGYDFMIQGLGGIMSLTGDPEGEPVKMAVAFCRHFHRLVCSQRCPGCVAGPHPNRARMPH